jgi:hypothetical protein
VEKGLIFVDGYAIIKKRVGKTSIFCVFAFWMEKCVFVWRLEIFRCFAVGKRCGKDNLSLHE